MARTSTPTSTGVEACAPRVRAEPLPPDERRSAIVAAAMPLFLEVGANVTTRQVAEAAGIAEGTIFRVFPDKDSLIAAVVEVATDPEQTERALAAIDPNLAWEVRLSRAADIVQQRLHNIWRLMSIAGIPKPGEVGSAPKRSPELRGLIAIFESEPDRSTMSPEAAARLMRGITLAMTHPALVGDEPMPPDEIVALLLDGIRRRNPEPSSTSTVTNGAASC